MMRAPACWATIGATAPFVGLFGTVWCIMNSFIGHFEVANHQSRRGGAGISGSAAGDRDRACGRYSGGRHLQRVLAPDRVLPRLLADARPRCCVWSDATSTGRAPQPASRRGMTLSAAE